MCVCARACVCVCVRVRVRVRVPVRVRVQVALGLPVGLFNSLGRVRLLPSLLSGEQMGMFSVLHKSCRRWSRVF